MIVSVSCDIEAKQQKTEDAKGVLFTLRTVHTALIFIGNITYSNESFYSPNHYSPIGDKIRSIVDIQNSFAGVGIPLVPNQAKKI